jgi:hypothetical protein
VKSSFGQASGNLFGGDPAESIRLVQVIRRLEARDDHDRLGILVAQLGGEFVADILGAVEYRAFVIILQMGGTASDQTGRCREAYQ